MIPQWAEVERLEAENETLTDDNADLRRQLDWATAELELLRAQVTVDGERGAT